MTIKPDGGMEYRYLEREGKPKLADGKLSGRAAPFDKQTMIGSKPWGFREKIAKGAFADSIKDGDVVLLDNHQHEKPISRQSAGTLALAETKGGLDWDAVPADTSYANDVRANAAAGNYGGCSFGFEVVRDTWHYNKDDDIDERTLLEVKLHEISVCTFPAYADGTSVSARDQVDAAKEARNRFYDREYSAWVVDGVSEDDERVGKSPYGDVAYADPGYQKDGKKRYPIDTKKHAKAAWSYINKSANQAPYSAKQLASIKSKIKAACKKFGVKVDENEANVETENREPAVTSKTKPGAIQAESGVTLKGGRKLLAKVRAIAFDETRAEDAATQIAEIRTLILNDLIKLSGKAAKRSNKPAKTPKGNNGVGTGSEQDGDSDDPTCPTCNGSGMDTDGVARCPGGCAGTGKLAGPGDNKGGSGSGAGDQPGAHKDAATGLGLNSKDDSDEEVRTDDADADTTDDPDDEKEETRDNADDDDGDKETSDEETRSDEDGEPDPARNTDAADAARRMKAAARRARLAQEARELADAEAVTGSSE